MTRDLADVDSKLVVGDTRKLFLLVVLLLIVSRRPLFLLVGWTLILLLLLSRRGAPLRLLQPEGGRLRVTRKLLRLGELLLM